MESSRKIYLKRPSKVIEIIRIIFPSVFPGRARGFARLNLSFRKMIFDGHK